MNCRICGREIPPVGYAKTDLCRDCYKQAEKSISSQKSTEEELRRRQQHFGSISLNETVPAKGYGNLSD